MNGTTTSTGQSTGEFTFALRSKVRNGQVVLWNWLEDSFAREIAEREDPCVAGVAGGEYPSESAENKANQSREQGHERRRLVARAMAKPL